MTTVDHSAAGGNDHITFLRRFRQIRAIPDLTQSEQDALTELVACANWSTGWTKLIANLTLARRMRLKKGDSAAAAVRSLERRGLLSRQDHGWSEQHRRRPHAYRINFAEIDRLAASVPVERVQEASVSLPEGELYPINGYSLDPVNGYSLDPSTGCSLYPINGVSSSSDSSPSLSSECALPEHTHACEEPETVETEEQARARELAELDTYARLSGLVVYLVGHPEMSPEQIASMWQLSDYDAHFVHTCAKAERNEPARGKMPAAKPTTRQET